jgi:sulfide:quinone oxidoreductase
MSAPAQNVVVLGAGVGGLVLANRLRRKLPRRHKIVLVDRSPVHTFAPSFLWVMTGTRSSKAITRPVAALLRPGIEFLEGEVTGIDAPGRRVGTSAKELSFDYLVMALGAELMPSLIPGLAEEAFSFYTLTEAERLYHQLEGFTGGTIVIVIASVPYKCPGAPHEAVMLLSDFFARRGLQRTIHLHLYTPEPQPMPVGGPQMGQAVQAMLESRSIGFHPLHKIVSVDSLKHELVFDGQPRAAFDLLIAIPPHRAPAVVQQAGLVDESGWVPVERTSLMTKWPGLYAIGDLAAIRIPGRWKPELPMNLPKAGVFAHVQAETVADRLIDEIRGKPTTAQFCGEGYCMLEAGDNMAGFAFGDFFAEPTPRLQLRNIGKAWHIGKVLFEKWWLASFGLRKTVLGTVLTLGARLFRIPVKL